MTQSAAQLANILFPAFTALLFAALYAHYSSEMSPPTADYYPRGTDVLIASFPKSGSFYTSSVDNNNNNNKKKNA